jgi:hypothetical protein
MMYVFAPQRFLKGGLVTLWIEIKVAQAWMARFGYEPSLGNCSCFNDV